MRNEPELSCAQAQEELLDAELRGTPAQAAALSHRAQCDVCREAVAELVLAVRGRREQLDEPLDAVTKQRLFAKAHADFLDEAARRGFARPWLWGLGLANAALAATVVFLLWSDRAPEGGRSCDGASVPTALSANVPTVALAPAREQITVGRGDGMVMSLDAHHVFVAAETALTVHRSESAIRIDLTRGLFAATGESRNARSLQVATERLTVEPYGTTFWVARGEEQDSVTVLEGEVVVTPVGQASVRLVGPKRVAVTKQAVLSVALVPEEQSQVCAQLELGHLCAAAAIANPNVRKQAGQALVSQAGVLYQEALAAAERGDCERARALLPELRSVLQPGDCAQALVSTAECHLRRGSAVDADMLFGEAMRLYPTTSAGQNAAYEVARLALRRNDRNGAAQAFADFAARYPEHPLADEALYRRCVLLFEDQKSRETESCCLELERRYPLTTHLREALWLRASVAREREHDCAKARPLYERYLAVGGERAAEAKRWLLECR